MKFFQSPEAGQSMSIEETPHGYAVQRDKDQLPYLHHKLDDTTIQRALYLDLPVHDLAAQAAFTELLYRRLSDRHGRRSARDVADGGIEIGLDESQRQASLLALAHLAVERPGWKQMLSEIALKMDNRDAHGAPDLFTKFIALHEADVQAR